MWAARQTGTVDSCEDALRHIANFQTSFSPVGTVSPTQRDRIASYSHRWLPDLQRSFREHHRAPHDDGAFHAIALVSALAIGDFSTARAFFYFLALTKGHLWMD
jgi:hypothetical protein